MMTFGGEIDRDIRRGEGVPVPTIFLDDARVVLRANHVFQEVRETALAVFFVS
jgi:hypothetical protein